LPSLTADVDEKQDHQDCNELHSDPPAHDLVGVFAIELAALSESADPEEKDGGDGAAGNDNEYEKGILKHHVSCQMRVSAARPGACRSGVHDGEEFATDSQRVFFAYPLASTQSSALLPRSRRSVPMM